jgi:hypothetical protein
MKIVTIERNMRPWRAGQDAVLPDELADKLVKAGDAKDPRPYPPQDVAPAVPVTARPTLKPARPYFTRNKRG